ncbi:MAG: DUF268 domain-containing protein [Candidatus Lokiarchaeia archaeon]
MKKKRHYKLFVRNWLKPIVNISHLKYIIPKYNKYLRDWKKYSHMKYAEEISLKNSIPSLFDDLVKTSFDPHYFYQDIWAFKRIIELASDSHVDVGSNVKFVGFLTRLKKVTFIDIRPLNANLDNLKSIKGNILSIPFEDNSINSISCLHVAEHIGLGRYGDKLDPLGTKKAVKELVRVLAKDGNLFFSLPIGKPNLCFNSHRIHSTDQILEYFSDLELIELSGVDDSGKYTQNINKNKLDSCSYGCGFFYFTKK